MFLAIVGSLAGAIMFVVLIIAMAFLPFDNLFVKIIIGSVSSAVAFWVAIKISGFPLHWAASGFITLNILAGAVRGRNLFVAASAILTTVMILVKMYT